MFFNFIWKMLNSGRGQDPHAPRKSRFRAVGLDVDEIAPPADDLSDQHDRGDQDQDAAYSFLLPAAFFAALAGG